MSHFTQVATKLADKEMLLHVLRELGYEVSENAMIRGYRGEETHADIAIRMKKGYDVGLLLQNDGTYSFIADWFGVEGFTREQFINKINHHYALKTVMKQVTRQGFNLVEQQKNEDGSIKVVVRRWV